MYRYIVNRVLLVIPTLVGAAALVFVLMRLIPGDICVVRLSSGGGSVDPRAVVLCHAELGLDRPIILQFLDFVWGFFRLDFGISMWSGKPVAEEIAARLPISLEIAVMATVVAIAISVPLGTISALKQNTIGIQNRPNDNQVIAEPARGERTPLADHHQWSERRSLRRHGRQPPSARSPRVTSSLATFRRTGLPSA